MLVALITSFSYLFCDRGESYFTMYDVFALIYMSCVTHQAHRVPNYACPSFVLSLRSDSVDSIGYLEYLTVIPT